MHLPLRSLTRKGFLGIFSVIGCTSAWAGVPPVVGVVAFSPLDAQAVPLLSDLMVLVLVALISVLAYRVLRSGAAGRPLASVVALGIALAGGVMSGRVQSVGHAAGVVVGLASPGGGSVNIVNVGVDVEARNLTPRTLIIKSVIPSPGRFVDTPAGTPECVAGLVLPPSASCFVLVF